VGHVYMRLVRGGSGEFGHWLVEVAYHALLLLTMLLEHIAIRLFILRVFNMPKEHEEKGID